MRFQLWETDWRQSRAPAERGSRHRERDTPFSAQLAIGFNEAFWAYIAIIAERTFASRVPRSFRNLNC